MHASTEGLQQYQVSTLTKHMNDKLTKSYWAEMERETMTVMAGFKKDEAYFVPRTKIGLPLATIEECIHKLFPDHYPRWKEEHQSPQGDHSDCAQKFFYRLLPFLVKVLLQDGIYLIVDYPYHEMSIMLHVSTFLKYNLACCRCTISNTICQRTKFPVMQNGLGRKENG